MIGQNIINHVFDNNIRNLFNSKNSKGDKYHRFDLIKEFLQ